MGIVSDFSSDVSDDTSSTIFFYYLFVNPSDDFTDHTDETITGYSGGLCEFLLMFVETLPTAKCGTRSRWEDVDPCSVEMCSVTPEEVLLEKHIC